MSLTPGVLSAVSRLLGLAGVLLLGAMSPGPSFLQVARLAMATSRRAALACAVGLGVGSGIFTIAALCGLQWLFDAAPWLFLACKLAGAAYLATMAWRLWRGGCPVQVVELWTLSARRACWLGLGTQLSNPKTALVFAAVFAALLPARHSLPFDSAVVLLALLVDGGWYVLVACLLSQPRAQAFYWRGRTVIDRVAGAVMGVLALRLASLHR